MGSILILNNQSNFKIVIVRNDMDYRMLKYLCNVDDTWANIIISLSLEINEVKKKREIPDLACLRNLHHWNKDR